MNFTEISQANEGQKLWEHESLLPNADWWCLGVKMLKTRFCFPFFYEISIKLIEFQRGFCGVFAGQNTHNFDSVLSGMI